MCISNCKATTEKRNITDRVRKGRKWKHRKYSTKIAKNRFARTWMNFKGIVLREKSDRER